MDAASGYGQHFSLQVLVLPVLPIRKAEFAKHLELLKQHSRIALADIPPPTGGSSTVLSTLLPTPVSRGFLNLSFVTEWDSSQAWLEEFQIHRKVHAVLGILDCAEWQDDSIGEGLHDGARRFHQLAADLAPRDVSAKRCYAFNPGEGHKDNTEGLVVIPDVGDLGFYLGTLLAELASSMLVGLSRTMVSLDSRSYVATPKERPGMSTLANNAVSTPRHSQENRLSLPDPSAQSKSPHILAGSNTDRAASPLGQTRPVSMIAESVDTKAKKRLPGRLHKLRGDIYCLAGRISEGLACYSEAVSATKSSGDFVWQAAALEASLAAQIYQSWSAGQPLARNSLAHSRRPSLAELAKQPAETAMLHNPNLGKELPVQFAAVFELYARSAPRRNSATVAADGQLQSPSVAADADDALHPLLLAESYFRYIRFQLAMLLHAAVWNQAVIGLIVRLGDLPWPTRERIQLFQYGLNGIVTKSDLLGNMSAAYNCACDPALTVSERTRFLTDLASIYDRIYCSRRQAGIQRELSALMAHVSSKETKHAESAPVSRSTGDLAEGLQDHAPTLVRSSSDLSGNMPILQLVEKACSIYGVAVVPTPEISDVQNVSLPVTRSEAGMLLLNLESVHFGWAEMQLAMVKDAIAVSQALSDYQGAIRFTITALRELAGVMESNDQLRYSQSIPRLFAAAAKRGANLQMAYWGPKNLVMSVEVASLQPSQLPYKVPYSDLDDANKLGAGVTDLRDRVYHSTSAKQPKENTNSILVQGELAEFYVTLQNPFLFNLEIERIAISTSGVDCQVKTLSSVIPPSSFHTIRLSCTPLAAGDLTIRGCKIKIAGCAEREFVVPLSDHALGSTSSNALQSRLKPPQKPERLPVKSESQVADAFLTCDVVPRQPSLRLRQSNLKHDSLVVYDGQRTAIRLTLDNVSELDIDWLRLSFTDSSTESMRAYLQEVEASDIEVYEIESEAAQRPVMYWKRGEGDMHIPSKTTKTLQILCTGKARLTSASIQIEYACVGAIEKETAETFLSRRLNLPLQVTVKSSVRCEAINILPVGSAIGRDRSRHSRSLSVTSIGKALAVDEQLEDGLAEMDKDTDCLLVVEAHNESLTQTFEVILSTKDGSGGRIKAQIDPDATFNLLLPVSRLALPPQGVARPIPSLSNKQFVLGKDKTTALEKEMFWYREALLSNLQLTWRETGTRTSGEAWLQDAEFTEGMLAALRLDEYIIDLAMVEDEEVLEADERGIWCTACEIFYEARVSLRDRRGRRAHLAASLSPEHTGNTSTLFDARITPLPAFHQTFNEYTMETDFLARQILIDGAKAVPLRPLDPGKPDAEVEASFPICFLSHGTFTLALTIRDEADNAVVTRTMHIEVQ